MDPRRYLKELVAGEYVLIEDYYHNGLQVLKALKKYLSRRYKTNTFDGERKFRAAYRRASHKLLLMVANDKLVVRKSPEIGWFKILYPDYSNFLISYPDVQGLNSSWQWYINGLDIDVLDHPIKPYYGVYFPTRYDHVEMLDEWLQSHRNGGKVAIDVGVGCGILSFLMIQHGYSKVIGTDINKNAIISTFKDLERHSLTERMKLYHGDLFDEIEEKADLIVFNPPWITADYKPETGIDRAIYYEPGLFDRFFSAALERLELDGRIIVLFSNLGQIVKEDSHPIYRELREKNRYTKVNLEKRKPKSASKRTKRRDRRDKELVELWELKINREE